MRILVLGATGFVGRNAAEWFSSKSHEVIRHGFNRPADIQADLRVPNSVDYTGFDVLIQAAAATSGCKDTLEDPAMHIANNAVMNSYIFPAAIKAGVKHIIFPSCSVMYQSSAIPLKEMDLDYNVPLNPAYLGFASTKLYCEKLCEFYANISDTRFTVMRNSNFFGSYDKYDPDHSHVFGASIAKVMNANDTVKVWGSGEEARDFLHIDNFCSFVDAALENQKSKFELFNCGSGIAVKIKDLVAEIIRVSGKDLAIEFDISKPTIPTAFSLDCSKAKQEIFWQPDIDLEKGIYRTLKWYQENVAV